MSHGSHREQSQDHAVGHLVQFGSKPSSSSDLIIHCSPHGPLPWQTMNELLGAGILTNLLLHFPLFPAQCVAPTRLMSAEGKRDERKRERGGRWRRYRRVIWGTRRWEKEYFSATTQHVQEKLSQTNPHPGPGTVPSALQRLTQADISSKYQARGQDHINLKQCLGQIILSICYEHNSFKDVI